MESALESDEGGARRLAGPTVRLVRSFDQADFEAVPVDEWVQAQVSIPSVVSIITQPTREGILSGLGIYQQDPSSAISLNVGTVSCAAGDFR